MWQGIYCAVAIRVIKFFRLRLLSLPNEEIIELLDNFEKESKALKRTVLKMCWYMRGGVTYDEMMMSSYNDREIINDIIKENLKTTEDSGLPFF